MSSVFFIADLHFGNALAAKQRGFSTTEEHDRHIIEKWNATIKNERQIVWILGDVALHKREFSKLDQLNGAKRLVMGNHD